MKAQKGADVSLYSFFKLRANGVDSQRHDPTGLPYRVETLYLLCRSMDGPTTGLDGGQNFALTEFRSQDRPALIKSLYRLSYTGPPNAMCIQHYKAVLTLITCICDALTR
jgi:hypothetical protein